MALVDHEVRAIAHREHRFQHVAVAERIAAAFELCLDLLEQGEELLAMFFLLGLRQAAPRRSMLGIRLTGVPLGIGPIDTSPSRNKYGTDADQFQAVDASRPAGSLPALKWNFPLSFAESSHAGPFILEP